jgi:hypothetical protein
MAAGLAGVSLQWKQQQQQQQKKQRNRQHCQPGCCVYVWMYVSRLPVLLVSAYDRNSSSSSSSQNSKGAGDAVILGLAAAMYVRWLPVLLVLACNGSSGSSRDAGGIVSLGVDVRETAASLVIVSLRP